MPNYHRILPTYDISLAKWTPSPWAFSDIWPNNPGQILEITQAPQVWPNMTESSKRQP